MTVDSDTAGSIEAEVSHRTGEEADVAQGLNPYMAGCLTPKQPDHKTVVATNLLLAG